MLFCFCRIFVIVHAQVHLEGVAIICHMLPKSRTLS
jgi:hypothetical protein